MINQVLLRVLVLLLIVGGVGYSFNTLLSHEMINPVPLRQVISNNYTKIVRVEGNPDINSISFGTGFIYNSDKGYVITAYHIIEGITKVRVVDFYNRTMKANIVGVNKEMDIVVLEVKELIGYPQVTIGDPNLSKAGDEVFLTGHPFGEMYTTTVGTVSSAVRRPLTVNMDINSGNSGGALFTANGKVIGMVTSRVIERGHSTGLGEPIPSNLVVLFANEIILKRDSH